MAKDAGDENNLKISEAAPKADEQKTFSVQKKSEKQAAMYARQDTDARGGLKAQTVKPENSVLARLNPFKNNVVGFIIVVILFAVIVTTASLIGNAKKSALKAAPVDDYSVMISRQCRYHINGKHPKRSNGADRTKRKRCGAFAKFKVYRSSDRQGGYVRYEKI